MKNDFNTVKNKIPDKLEFHSPHERFWRSQYELDGTPFMIQAWINDTFLLRFNPRFLVQFKGEPMPGMMIFKTFEDAERVAQLMYKGKAGAVEQEIRSLLI
jgi:hypothetical protein